MAKKVNKKKKTLSKKSAPKKASKPTSKKTAPKKAAPKRKAAGKPRLVAVPKKVTLPKKAVLSPTPAAKPQVKVAQEPVARTPKLTVVPAPQPTVPTRAPLRKVYGANNTITIVPKPGAQPAAAPVEAAAVPSEPELPVLKEVPRPEVVQKIEKPERPKLAWTDLPSALPAQVKFLVDAAKKECAGAGAWPFAFAKFIASLPDTLCGFEFAALVMSLEHAPDAIAEICKVDQELVEDMLIRGSSDLQDTFSSHCPEIFRKWRAHIGGSALGVESLVEQHLLAKVDRNFQVMLGAVLLKAMGAKNALVNVTPLRDRWSVSSKVIH
jgi:hypothetical protein